ARRSTKPDASSRSMTPVVVPKNLENGVLHGSDLVSGEPLSRATSDLLAGLSKQEGDAVLNAVHNACHASILYRCSLYTRSLASAFREPACSARVADDRKNPRAGR